jgi:LysM repeat protein
MRNRHKRNPIFLVGSLLLIVILSSCARNRPTVATATPLPPDSGQATATTEPAEDEIGLQNTATPTATSAVDLTPTATPEGQEATITPTATATPLAATETATTTETIATPTLTSTTATTDTAIVVTSTPTPLPQATAVPMPKMGGNRYMVQRGDTLFSIARQFGVSVWELAKVNEIYNINFIYVGQVLVIPKESAPPRPETYTVRYGDTLFSIGRQFGISAYVLAEHNNIQNTDLIYAGQVLRIPPR